MGNCAQGENGIIPILSQSPPPLNPSNLQKSLNTQVLGEQILENNKEKEIQIISKSTQMGKASSQSIAIVISSSFCPQQINISPRTQVLGQQILNDFSVGREIFRMMNGVAYTQNQAKDLVKALIQGIITLEKPETEEQKKSVKKLFNEQNIKLIKREKLFYYGMLDKLNNKTISQSSKSRIYHTIANIKKDRKIQKTWTNQYNIKCIKSNDYKELSEAELQEIVKYETIADHIRQMGEKINFKFQSINKQSQKMVNLLGQCMKKHIGYINQLKYDLSEEQVMEIAKISRQGCNYYENGVFVLLAYFVQSSKRLQSQAVTTQNIEELLKRAIQNISNMYPPGKGLSEQHQGLKTTLKELGDPKKYKKVGFFHKKRQIKSTNKQIQVQNIIIQYAKIAQSNKQLFQELVKATCLSRCVYFKIGLKYYPSNPNKKALTRIKQKMFFKKEQKSEKNMNGSIKEILNKQQIAYRTIIDEILKDTDSIQFTISDMVRGKCVFLEISEIIQSVNAIKKFIQKDPRYGIKQIESRFTNAIPISDVTLKIVLNNQIVAQLQLTIQNNAATYNFAHKIYQLQRTKVFSKLKITHNYYEESVDDFNELAKRAFKLQDVKSLISSQVNKSISQYFKLNQISLISKPFQRIVQEYVQENNQIINNLVVSVDSNLQELINIAFNLALNRWGKTIGKIINQALTNDNTSSKLKSVILSIFFEAFQLPVQSQYMHQIGIVVQQLQNKIFMEEYMREYFSISKAYQYVKQNQRLFNRAQQLKLIKFSQLYNSASIQLRKSAFAENLVIEQHCFQKVIKLRELFNFYFVTRTDEQDLIYDNFSDYYNWIKSQLQINNNSDAVPLRSQIQIIKAQELLQKNQLKQAQKILLEALDIFNRREEYSKVIECQILLTECSIKATNKQLKDYIDYHDRKVVQKAQILGQQLKGALYADTIWRISQYLWNKVTKDEKRLLLRTFTSIAISQMSRSKGKQFISALCKRWNEYDKEGQEKPKIRENNKIQYVKLYNIGDVGCEHLSKAYWKSLTNLNLSILMDKLVSNNIGDVGCEHLSKAYWKSLTNLNLCILIEKLGQNNIGAVGCEHLSKADCKSLTNLNLCLLIDKLGSNDIGDVGCEHLSKADWKSLTNLNLSILMDKLVGNNIGAVGCEHMSKADWKNLTNLNLSILIDKLVSNNIGAVGCEHLSKADWKSLTNLNLSILTDKLVANNIGDIGCEHLSKAYWKSLTHLYLIANHIGDVGCEHLSKADWNSLTNLQLYNNNIGDEGCAHLSKANWKNLKELQLDGDNNIQDKESAKRLFTQKQLKILI